VEAGDESDRVGIETLKPSIRETLTPKTLGRAREREREEPSQGSSSSDGGWRWPVAATVEDWFFSKLG